MPQLESLHNLKENVAGIVMKRPNESEDEDELNVMTPVTVGETGYTLYEAIMKENTTVISKIVDSHIVNTPIRHLAEFTKNLTVLPIHLAASFRKFQSLQTLLDYGANPELSDQHGRNTLHLVIMNWPSIMGTWTDCHPKFQSAVAVMQQRAEDCLQVLCKHGVNINARMTSPCQQTALHLAVSCRALSAIGILGSQGVGVNFTDRFGMTPLHMAAGVLHTEIVSSLIHMGADVNQVVKHSGNSALHLAVQAVIKKFSKTQVSDPRCIKELLKRGASPDMINTAGRTPLHKACHGGKEEVVDQLLAYGADINKLTPSGENCLFLFLSQASNLTNTTLLAKLLCLTNPLALVNKQIPLVLMLPQYSRQKQQLMHLSQQPRDLFEICKIHLVQYYKDSCRIFLKEMLPEKLYNSVFDHWDCLSYVDFN